MGEPAYGCLGAAVANKWASEGAVVFQNATVLDGSRDMEARPGRTVVVEGQTISYVGSPDEAPIPQGARTIDLAGAYLMPGLINLHVHLVGTGDERGSSVPDGEPVGQDNRVRACMDDPERLHAYMREAVANELASGVTTLRDAGEPYSADIWVRDAIDAGEVVGPRIIASGNGITVPEGHASRLMSRAAHTPEEAACYVRDFAELGATSIKLFVTGGVLDAVKIGEPGVLRMSPRITKAACDEAHRLGLRVMAHVESTEGVKSALENGVDSIEHGAPMTPEIVELYKQRGASVTCTLSPAVALTVLPTRDENPNEMLLTNARVVAQGVAQSARTALDEGIPLGLGTDASCPFITQYDTWRELAYLVRYLGVTPAFALHTATQANARILGLGDVCGTVEAGKDADLIVTADNPLENIAALRHVSLVMSRGRLLEKPCVAHIDQIDADLDWLDAQPDAIEPCL
ncbi:MAG: amidohydrolase family protein [Coriobacteriia bacterium]|nr:amidohydrolase family protein [Coriobacteriia bacterium]